MRFDERGRELPDDTPVEVPLHFKRPPTIQEMIRQHIRTEMSREASQQGEESFEEADDFEMDEDPDPLSAYELQEMQMERPVRREAPQEKAVPDPAEQAVAPSNPATPEPK